MAELMDHKSGHLLRTDDSRSHSLGWRRTAVCCAMTAVFLAGCQSSQQASISNPFLSSDRVPAPPSRIPPQGTAQPYYPSDALPPLPGGGQAAGRLSPLAPSPDITPIPDSGTLTSAPAGSITSVASGEPAVQIPTDESPPRLGSRDLVALQQPRPEGVPNEPQAQQLTFPVETAFRHPEAVPRHNVAAHVEPSVSATSAPQVILTAANEEVTSGFFRQPNVPTQAPPLIEAAGAPRIRLPGAASRIREEVATPGTLNTTNYQVGLAGGGQLETAMLPPPGYVPDSLSEHGLENSAPAGDGFRPRGSARSRSGGTSVNPSIPTLRVTPG